MFIGSTPADAARAYADAHAAAIAAERHGIHRFSIPVDIDFPEDCPVPGLRFVCINENDGYMGEAATMEDALDRGYTLQGMLNMFQHGVMARDEDPNPDLMTVSDLTVLVLPEAIRFLIISGRGGVIVGWGRTLDEAIAVAGAAPDKAGVEFPARTSRH